MTCEMCGMQASKLSTEGHCVMCEARTLAYGVSSTNAALEIVGGAVAAALNGYVSPEDLLWEVHKRIADQKTVPAMSLAELSRRVYYNDVSLVAVA